MADIFGTSGNDYYGPNANPLGGDNFFMGDGNDFVYANTGPDFYIGGAGIDSVSYRFATAGVTLSLTNGGTGGMATGHVYNSIERIYGSNFDDVMTGGASTDFFYGGTGSDTLSGEGGKDRIFGGEGNDFLNGGADNDYIEGGLGSDSINGGAGNDYIDGGDGADTIDGGDGIDTVGYLSASEGVNVNLSNNNPPPPPPPPPPQQRDLDLPLSIDSDGDIYFNIENIVGSLFDDVLVGNESNNLIQGRAGDDALNGDDGNDSLFGGAGNDSIWGGDGNDSLYGEEGADFLNGGNGADNIRGGAGDDNLYGGEGNDRIYLGDGNDYTQGGEGNDFFYLTNDGDIDEVYGGNDTNGDGPNTDNGFDTVSYIQATGGVEVYLGDLIPFRPPEPVGAEPLDETVNMPALEEDLLVGIERIIGSNFDDAISGGSDDETIFGGNGDDFLAGGSGRDRLIGGSGADEFSFSIGFGDVDSILDFVQGTDTITFITDDEGLTEADVLATVVDYGVYFVFEFGASGLSGIEQRLAVIKDDPDMVLTVDDFTIEIFMGVPFDPIPESESLIEGLYGENLTEADMAFAEFDALI